MAIFKPKTQLKLIRAKQNPIIRPKRAKWERRTYNPGVILIKDKIYILYRAEMTIGYASTEDGVHIKERLTQPIFIPTEKYDEHPGYPGAEDPRLVQIMDRLYMTYTLFEGDFSSIKMALTSIKVKDFLSKRWRWRQPVLMTPPGKRHKNVVLFPEKIKNKFAILHRISPKVSIKYVKDIDKYFNGKRYFTSVYKKVRRNNSWDTYIRGAGPPPIRTDLGWLLLYHAIDEREPHRFKIGAMILDFKDPTKILYRSHNALLAPDKSYENRSIRPGSRYKSGVVYASGAVVKNGTLLVYYGGADSVTCVASIPMKKLLLGLVKQDQEFKESKKRNKNKK
ncbi:MAG: hypothetical protein M3M85_04360 [bacterium]|nr:hypothetical protein [bacterium]